MSKLGKQKNSECLLRSMLFIPVHIDRFVNHGLNSQSDALIFDLEDSVPADKKILAREKLKYIAKSVNSKRFHTFVRINSIHSSYINDDLKCISTLELDGIVLPKVNDLNDIKNFVKKLNIFYKNRSKKNKLSIIPLIESAGGVLNSFYIAQAAKNIIALAFGSEDFIADMGTVQDKTGKNLFIPRALIAIAAKAAKVQAIDTVYLDIYNKKGLIEQAKEGRNLGFSGMLVLHPNQIEVANRYFSPSKKEFKFAQQVIETIEESEKKGQSVVYVDNKFIAPPIVKQSISLINLSNLIQKKVVKSEKR